MRNLIIIWGVLIALYLIVTHSSGTTAGFAGLQNLVTGSTKALQGR